MKIFNRKKKPEPKIQLKSLHLTSCMRGPLTPTDIMNLSKKSYTEHED